MKIHRTSIRKNLRAKGGYVVTNYRGEQLNVATKERANEIANASKQIAAKRKKIAANKKG